MLRLREKAHISLSAHRNTPPSRQGTLSEPTTPADDNDELSTLGGRTRLVAQKEKSPSPIIGELSPTSLNPIVPFPMKQEFDQQAHPYVLEYLRTFASHAHSAPQPQPHPTSPYEQAGFSSDMNPMSSSSSNFMPGAYPFRGQLSPMEGISQQTIPQYFPVFDYGYVGGADSFSGMPTDPDMASRSYSPEASMQTAWQDFVAQIGHMQ